MAKATVVALSNYLVDPLISIEAQVEWIERELRLMQSSLEGVEANRHSVEDEMKWAGEAREIFQKVENMIDVFLIKNVQYRRRGIFGRSVFFLSHLGDQRKFSLKVEKIKVQIRDLSKRRPKQPEGYSCQEISSSAQTEPSTSHEPQILHAATTAVAAVIDRGTFGHPPARNIQRVRVATPFGLIERSDIVSFHYDLEALVALLLTNNEHRSIISIVGMEGIGKTTLAELLYENIAVRQHFPCKAWVSIESDCNVKALIRCIKEQVLVSLQEHRRKPLGLHEQDEELDAEEVPGLMLSAILEVNRYLIVLDGVNTAEIWDRLMKEFPSTLHGSRIVLTTRDVDVATHADPKNVHKLRLLSDDDSWALFTKTLTVPHGVLERSRKMVNRCGGLPGAIIQLREQFERTESTSGEWLRVLENPKHDQKPWKKMLDMMNGGLPLYLERCLFYLGRFPLDIDISLRRLTALWIAEGLVHQRRGDQDSPETVAGRCLAELIDRNMVQVTKMKLNGAVKNCRLPYALREIWSSSEPKKVAYPKSHPNKNPKLSPTSHKTLYLTHLHDGDSVSFNHILGDTTNLSPSSLLPGYKHVISFRSFDTRKGILPGKELAKFLKHCVSRGYFQSLRVLDLERVFRPELPEALGELILLRYLSLRFTYLDFLPSFINKLLNLQTLDVKNTFINTLPTSIWKMEQLRHLYLDENYRCRFLPRQHGYSLTDLQTLWSVFIDEDSPVKDGLDSFINLKRLGVTSRLMSSREEAMLSQLIAVADWVEKLKLLQSLRLKSFDKQGKPWQLPKMDLTGHTDLSSLYLLGRIAFLASMLTEALTELTLSGSGLTEDPMPTLGELPNLKILRLFRESFVGKHMLCRSEGFPQLRILKTLETGATGGMGGGK